MNTTDSIIVKGNKVTRAHVLAAMAECDRVGEAAFLSYYGFRKSQSYWLRGNKTHRPYPSKAILAVAARCTKRHGYKGQFFGGVAHTVNQLRRLGFEFRVGDKPVRTIGMDDLREQAVALDADFVYVPEWDKLSTTGVTPVAVFASGSNTANTIKGMASVRMDIGVAAPHISRVCKDCKRLRPAPTECEHSNESSLKALVGTDVQVFCDSGAFSEVVFESACDGEGSQNQTPNWKRGSHKYPKGAKECQFCGSHKDRNGGPARVVKPITDKKWTKILDLYERLGTALKDQVWLVAPDMVGSQEVTLERLTHYGPRLQKIADTGAIVMVVAQKGALSQADFFRAAIKAAGLEGRGNVVAAAPCKKAATTSTELEGFVRDLEPEHVHCLGLGPTNPRITEYMDAFAGTKTTVSLDSCWITANVAKARGRQKAKRFTRAQELARVVLGRAGVTATVQKVVELGLLLCLGSPLVDPASQIAYQIAS